MFLCGSFTVESVCASGFKSWIWCEHKSCISSGCFGIFLLGSGAGDGETWLEINVSQSFPSAFWLVWANLKLLQQKPGVSSSLQSMFFPLQVLQHLSEEKYWGNRTCMGTPIVSGCRLWQSSLGQRFALLLICCLCKYQACLPPPCSDATLGLSLFWFSQPDYPLKPVVLLLAYCRPCCMSGLVCVGSQCVRVQALEVWPQTETGLLVLSCLCKCQQWLPPLCWATTLAPRLIWVSQKLSQIDSEHLID